MPDLEKSQASTHRKQEEEKRERLFKIVGPGDIARLKLDILSTIKEDSKK
jgi:hypothetical protein